MPVTTRSSVSASDSPSSTNPISTQMATENQEFKTVFVKIQDDYHICMDAVVKVFPDPKAIKIIQNSRLALVTCLDYRRPFSGAIDETGSNQFKIKIPVTNSEVYKEYARPSEVDIIFATKPEAMMFADLIMKMKI